MKSTTALSTFQVTWDGNAYCDQSARLKESFHRIAAKQLRDLAKKLGLSPGSFEVRSNKAGIAVSGEVTLHGEQIYVQVGGAPSGLGILVRTCNGKRDYTGHTNHWFSLSALDEGERFAQTVNALIVARFGNLTNSVADDLLPLSVKRNLSAFVDWTPNPRGTQYYRVAGVGARGGEVGECIGILGLKHAPGYEAILRFVDGALESFAPHALFPAQVGEVAQAAQAADRIPRTLELPL